MSEALEYLKALIEAGWEYPDAEYKAAKKYQVPADDLRGDYDRHSKLDHRLKTGPVEAVTIGGNGFFAGCKVYIDPTLPSDTVEVRGENGWRMNLATGEIAPATADRSA